MHDEQSWLARLEADGYLVVGASNGHAIRLTSRWHAALARAAFSLYRRGEELEDLRVPIAGMLVAAYPEQPTESIVIAVHAVLPLVVAELSRTSAAAPAPE